MTATLERYMTRYPHSIRHDETLATAAKLMRSLRVRHLPLLDGGRLVGVVSDRDIKLPRGVDLEQLKVSDICIDDPYTVDVDTGLHVVATVMAEKKIGSALVVDESGRVIGIFTAVDACRALADALAPVDE